MSRARCYDRAHLRLIEFMASYYMVPLAEVMQSVIPAAARVESRRSYRLAAPPDASARGDAAPIERAIIDALGRRPMTARQLARLASGASRLGARRLAAEGIVETARGRPAGAIGRASPSAWCPALPRATKLRGEKQREVMRLLGRLRPKPRAGSWRSGYPARVAVRALARARIGRGESASQPAPPFPGDGPAASIRARPARLTARRFRIDARASGRDRDHHARG